MTKESFVIGFLGGPTFAVGAPKTGCLFDVLFSLSCEIFPNAMRLSFDFLMGSFQIILIVKQNSARKLKAKQLVYKKTLLSQLIRTVLGKCLSCNLINTNIHIY